MDYWHKQTTDQPLFPDLLWSRPENKRHAGKLLIIGGNSFGFSAVGEAYNEAQNAGAGTVRVLLPEAVRKVVGRVIEHAEFAPSNPSGSFSQAALGGWLAQADWADGVLLTGDLGHNSETAIVLEQFLAKYSGQVTLTQDAVEYCLKNAAECLQRPNTTLVVTMAQLQKIGVNAKSETAFTFDMGMLSLLKALHAFTLLYPASIVIKHMGTYYVTTAGQVSTTKSEQSPTDTWRIKTAAHTAVWQLQNPAKTFESITSSLSTN